MALSKKIWEKNSRRLPSSLKKSNNQLPAKPQTLNPVKSWKKKSKIPRSETAKWILMSTSTPLISDALQEMTLCSNGTVYCVVSLEEAEDHTFSTKQIQIGASIKQKNLQRRPWLTVWIPTVKPVSSITPTIIIFVQWGMNTFQKDKKRIREHSTWIK